MSETHRALVALRDSTGPLVAGPWMSEIGFELLYWIPFLRWCASERLLDVSRLTILSRGGCRSWYRDLGEYRDAYDHFTPDEFRRLNDRRIREQAPETPRFGMRKGQLTAKHLVSGAVDAEILQRCGLGGRAVLHPFLMYRMFRAFWTRLMPELHKDRTRIRLIVPPPKPADVPESYVAVKFYASQACPATGGHRVLVNQIVRQLVAQVGDVVLLHTGTPYDDHGEFPIDHHPRVHRRRFTPNVNLDEQTAILGGASAFVGTYGGFAYLAPFLGVPTLGLYGVANFRRDHLTVMQTTAAHRLKVPFSAMLLSAGQMGVKRLGERGRHVA